MSRRGAGVGLRILVTVAFGALALWGTGIGPVLDALEAGRPSWILGALAVLSASYAVAATRWWLLMRGQGLDVSLRRAVSLTWIGLFAGNVLPTGFGGDAVRAWIVGRRSGTLALVTASVLVDRLTAVWALLGLGVLAVAVQGSPLPEGSVISLLVSTGAVAVGSVLLLTPAPARRLTHLTRRWPAVSDRVARLSDGLSGFRGRPRLLGAAVVASVLCQSCVIVAAWMLARGLGLELGLAIIAVTVPVALLATAVPTSINGLGVHQAVFRALLVPAGIAPAQAVAFSVSTIAAGAFVSLPGAVLWIRSRRIRQGRLSAWSAQRPSLRPRTPTERA